MADSSSFIVRDRVPIVATGDVVTISLGYGSLGGELIIRGAFTGTLSFTSDSNGLGTFSAQSLTSLSGASGSSLTGTGRSDGTAVFVIPSGIVSLRVTGTSVTSGSVMVSWSASARNNPVEAALGKDRAARRAQLFMETQSRYAETFPFAMVTSTNIKTSGTVYYAGISLLAGDVVSNIHVAVGTAGATFSGIGSKVGLYTAISGTSGTLVAQSADISAQVSSTGVKVLPLTQPYVVPIDGSYYVAWITVATTPPTPGRSAVGSTAFTAALAGSTVAVCGAQAGQTDLPATATIANNTQSAYWFGIS